MKDMQQKAPKEHQGTGLGVFAYGPDLKDKNKNLSTMFSYVYCQESGGEGSQVIPLKLGI
jgi:hypothetical protein